MAVDPTGSITTPTAAASQVQRDGSSLDKDAFLKILVGELQNMDPMSSSNQDPTQSVTQMTQYSILEQLTNLSSSASSTLSAQKQTQSIELLGKTVDYTAKDGTNAQGVVQKVDFASDGTIQLTIDGQTGIAPSAISGVS
jgi:flagellar basal-body rod modification protein FlgD